MHRDAAFPFSPSNSIFYGILQSAFQFLSDLFNFNIQCNCNMVIWNRTGNSANKRYSLVHKNTTCPHSQLYSMSYNHGHRNGKATGELVKVNAFSYLFYWSVSQDIITLKAFSSSRLLRKQHIAK